MGVTARLALSLAIVFGGFGYLVVVAIMSYWCNWDASCTSLNDVIYYGLLVLGLGAVVLLLRRVWRR